MTSAYLTNWLYVWLFIVAGAALVVVILLFSKLINPSHLTPEKLQPYECGIPPVGNPWQPFAVRYFVFGLLFLVFDVESAFLFPWAIVFRGLGTAGFIEMLLFIAVLAFGLLYAWRKGALEWAERDRLKARPPGPYPKLEHFERAQRHHHHRRLHLQLGALALGLPVHLRPGLLRHRDAHARASPATTSPATAWRSSAPRRASATS